MTGRSVVLAVCFALTGALVQVARQAEASPPRASLSDLPLKMAGWTGRPSPPLDSRVLAALGSDEYVDRVYIAAGQTPVALFVGYYASQRQGDTMHSPLNCLPGDGWTPMSHATLTLRGADGQAAAVNRYVIEKGGDRQIVLYWYQGRGRIVANEYAAKAYLVFDAMRRGRTDGALVRVVTPITGSGGAAEREAEARAADFAAAVLPLLGRSLPS